MSNAQIPRAQIRYLVGNRHVSTSPVDIVRDLRRRMKGDQWTKRVRKMVYRYALKCHQENRQLYRDVMRGA